MKNERQRRQKMLEVLSEQYKGTTTALRYSSPFELLIAVILSAQCTDERVNIITARLFPKYNRPEFILELGQDKLEEYIKDCGLFRSKAKNIIAACEILCRKYHGEVPGTFNELIELPGVGRKTANVLLSQLFGTPALAVDTHVFRVANRTGLARGKNPLEVEEGLMRVIPKKDWSEAHHWLIWHGRKVCTARRPHCEECQMAELCPRLEELKK